MTAPLILALTTEASLERAEALARTLLERRLAACVALTPIHSFYHWQGRIEGGQEVQLLIKTHPERLEQLTQGVQELHSYDTPEWIHWEAEAAPDYGGWLEQSCAAGPGISPGGQPPTPGESPGDGDPAG
jgi:periplasmic divalent cation tolerance protein